MQILGQDFSCNWILSWSLALPCPPLEVSQDKALVVGQGRLGE